MGRNYSLALLFITPLALLMTQLAHPVPAAPLLQARAVETVLGALCGMVVIYFWRNSEERRADTQAMPRIIAASQADRRGGPADADLDGAAAGEDDDGHSAPSQDRSR